MDKPTKDAINGYVNGVKTGDKVSLELLYSAVSSTIRHIALRYLKNEPDADDLVQDFWADIYKISLGFVFCQNAFSYLCKVITRRALNRYKKIHRERCQNIEYVDYRHLNSCAQPENLVKYQQPSTADDAIEKLEQEELNLVVDQAIDRLSSIEKIIIQMVFFEDKTVREIARELKISKSLVSKQKIIAIEKLKTLLDEYFVDKRED